MRLLLFFTFTIALLITSAATTECGCRYLRPCYREMIKDLLQPDEDPCIKNVSIGASTVTIFLKALSKYCGHIIKVYSKNTTHEGRNLYEVVINGNMSKNINRSIEEKPVILLEAGQDAGTDTVALALYVIEQLVACGENKEMIQKVRWVVLPSTNPDGQEYVRTKREPWKKNYSPQGKEVTSFGVDITRNFEDSWGECPSANNVFSQDYPGPKAGSEKETAFVSEVLAKYRSLINTYVSLRRDGHGIFYPLASQNVTIASLDQVRKRAGDVSAKVNQRAGGIQWFLNQSIFAMNGKAHCGHSVDYAYNRIDVKYAFEMRVFPEIDNRIMSKFQTLPKGHIVSLRNGYFSGIKRIYNLVVNDYVQSKTLIQ